MYFVFIGHQLTSHYSSKYPQNPNEKIHNLRNLRKESYDLKQIKPSVFGVCLNDAFLFFSQVLNYVSNPQ